MPPSRPSGAVRSGGRAVVGFQELLTLPRVPTRQFDLNVVAAVRLESLNALNALLEQIGRETAAAMQGHGGARPVLDWAKIDSLHEARLLVLPGEGGDPPLLVLTTYYDGPRGSAEVPRATAQQQHLKQLVAHAGTALDSLLTCCEGYAGRSTLERYLAAHTLAASALYTASSGRTRDQVLAESSLRLRVLEHIGALRERHGPMPADRLRTEVQQLIGEDLLKTTGMAAALPKFPPQPRLSHRLWLRQLSAMLVVVACGAAAAWGPAPAVLASVAVLAAMLAFRWLLSGRMSPPHSKADRERASSSSAEAPSKRPSPRSEGLAQNHFAVAAPIARGWLSRLRLRASLSQLDFACRNVFNQGLFGTSREIHGARWCELRAGRLLFFSATTDAAWEGSVATLMGEGPSVCNRIWRQTLDFPRQAGAAPVREWTERRAAKTPVWYCAYPHLTIGELNANTNLRRGLADPDSMSAAEWERWLLGA